MRTTIDMSDELYRQAKKRAAEESMTLRALIEAALRLYLGGKGRAGEYKFEWKTFRGKLQPGVDLDDRNSLFDLMDGR
jgi:hypothetical protein